MKAWVEHKPDKYRWEERGSPKCGQDFCDDCGDCLHCYPDRCVGQRPGSDTEGGHRWVIYFERCVMRANPESGAQALQQWLRRQPHQAAYEDTILAAGYSWHDVRGLRRRGLVEHDRDVIQLTEKGRTV